MAKVQGNVVNLQGVISEDGSTLLGFSDPTTGGDGVDFPAIGGGSGGGFTAVAFGTTLAFDGTNKEMPQTAITGALAFTSTGSTVGTQINLCLVANGTNVPTFPSSFKEATNSAGFDNTINVKNYFKFEYTNGKVIYGVFQEIGDTGATLLEAPDPEVDLFGISISRIGAGSTSTFTTSYNPDAVRAALSPVNTFYVDSLTGNNNFDGTSGAPFRSMDLAVKMAADTGVLCLIKVKGTPLASARQLYKLTNTQARSGQPTNNATWGDAWTTAVTDAKIIIEPWNEGEYFDSVRDVANVTWTQSTLDTNVWYNSSAGALIHDYSNLDDFGQPMKLAQLSWASGTTEATAVADIAAAYALYQGTFPDGSPYVMGVAGRVSGTLTYIRLFDNRNPNSDPNIVIMAASGNGAQMLTSASAPFLYAKNAGFLGGITGAFAVTGTNGFRPSITTVNCRFGGSINTAAGAFVANGSTTTDGVGCIHYQSSASYGIKDGWNYHQDCTVIEINCAGNWNGWDTGLTNNGSTIHETTNAIRVGGKYLNNQDRAIHDVGTAKSWNLGITSSTRQGSGGGATSTSYAVGIDGTTGAATMWLDACHVANGINGAPAYTSQVNRVGCSLLYANLDFTPVLGPAASPGTLGTYTP